MAKTIKNTLPVHTHNFFYKDPASDPVTIIKNYTDKQKGQYFYFRTSCLRMQDRFTQLTDASQMPVVFLHGNPHLDNYVKTDKGAAMIDFDRSRFGPYGWDIVRLLSSISFRNLGTGDKFLSNMVLDYFYEGYTRSFSHDTMPYKQLTHLENVQPQKWQRSVNDYVKSNNGWAKKLKDNAIPVDDAAMNGILLSYLESRDEKSLIDEYFVEKAAKAAGTMLNKRYLVLLSPKVPQNGDKILLDLKTVYKDPDNEWFYNPYDHHGLRMIKAAEIYAPEIEERLGYATYNNEQYWGRAIPSFSHKIKDKLHETLQIDLAYSVGTQLGQAHKKSLVGGGTEILTAHLEKNYKDFVEIGKQMNAEVRDAYKQYLQQAKKIKI